MLKEFFKTRCLQLIFFTLLAFFINSSYAVTDPYAAPATVTNSIAWPYNSETFGNDTFKMGTAKSGNSDSLLLQEVDQNNGLTFPDDFDFGVAYSAYQYEGNRVAPSSKNTDGIGWSMWDVFSQQGSWLDPKGTNIAKVLPTSLVTYPSGKNAVEGFYPNFYQQDIQLEQSLGVKYIRLSISWPRLFPHRGMTEPDPKAIAHYKKILEQLKKAHFTILITLYHWDLPAWLYNYGDPNIAEKDKTYGWLDPSQAKDNLTLIEFQKYADSVYKNFLQYTPYFATFNEPLTFTNNGLYIGNHAPGKNGFALLRQKNPQIYGVDAADSDARINYLQSVNLIKAHYIAYKTFEKYRKKIKEIYGTDGKLGIVLNSDWAEPYRVYKDEDGTLHYNKADVAAAKRNMDFMLGWWLEPVMYGHWPASMIKNVGSRLPNLYADSSCLDSSGVPVACHGSHEQRLSSYIKSGGALDYLNINHYTGYFVADLDYAKNHFSDTVAQNSVPPNEYGGTPFNINPGWDSDQDNFITQFRYQEYGDNGKFADKNKQRAYVIGMTGAQPWLRHTYFAYTKLLQYIDYYYLNTAGQTKQGVPFSSLGIYLTENGTSLQGESQKPFEQQLHDPDRIRYIKGNLAAVWQAIQDGINVKLYTYWSIVDNFEWAEGYDSRFGLVWIDYANNYQRKPKDSYYYYQKVIENHRVMP